MFKFSYLHYIMSFFNWLISLSVIPLSGPTVVLVFKATKKLIKIVFPNCLFSDSIYHTHKHIHTHTHTHAPLSKTFEWKHFINLLLQTIFILHLWLQMPTHKFELELELSVSAFLSFPLFIFMYHYLFRFIFYSLSQICISLSLFLSLELN